MDFILKHKSLLDPNNLFTPNKYEINDKLMLIIFNNLKLKIHVMDRFLFLKDYQKICLKKTYIKNLD